MSSSLASTQNLANSRQHSPAPYVTHDSAPPPTTTTPTTASPGGEVLIDRMDEFIEVFFTLGHFTSEGSFCEKELTATQEQHECLASIIIHWLNGADTIVKAKERGKRIAQRLLLGGLKRGIETKEFNTFIVMVRQAFKELLDKLEAEEKSDNGTDSFMSLSERKEDMAAKRLDSHCNSLCLTLCLTLFMEVEDAIAEELKALALEAALDSLVEACDRHLAKSGDGVVMASNPDSLGEMDNYGEKELDSKSAGAGDGCRGKNHCLTFPDIPDIEEYDDVDIHPPSSGAIMRT